MLITIRMQKPPGYSLKGEETDLTLFQKWKLKRFWHKRVGGWFPTI